MFVPAAPVGAGTVTAKKQETATEKRDKALANRSGVFTLDELNALGQTGDFRTDYMAAGRTKAEADWAESGSAMWAKANAPVSLGLSAGYYQTPGIPGAEYYDPKAGGASKELQAAFASGNLDRDIAGIKTPLDVTGDTGEAFRRSGGQQFARLAGQIIASAKNRGTSLQEAQDRALGTGAFQRFVTGRNGEQIRVEDVPGYAVPDAATAPYQDLTKTREGAFARLMKETGLGVEETSRLLNLTERDDASLQARADYFKTRGQTGSALNYAYEKPISPGSPVTMQYTPEQLASMSDVGYWKELRDSLAANYEKTVLSRRGLGESRSARGLDPETGVGESEKRRIYDTYSRISDPEQKAAYLRYQDPGNLTAAERFAQADIRAPEDAAIAEANRKYDTTEATHFYQGKYYPGEARITSGAQVVKDPGTGRSAFLGNVPYKLEYTAPKDTSKSFAARFGGAIGGGLFGFLSGMGSPWGAAIGAWVGAGGWMPNARNIGFNKGGLGIGKGFAGGQWGRPAAPGPASMKVGMQSIMFSSVLGAAGAYAKGGAGALRGPGVVAG